MAVVLAEDMVMAVVLMEEHTPADLADTIETLVRCRCESWIISIRIKSLRVPASLR